MTALPLHEPAPRAAGRRPVDITYPPHTLPRGLRVATHSWLMEEWDDALNEAEGLDRGGVLLTDRYTQVWWRCRVCAELWQQSVGRRYYHGSVNCPQGCIPTHQLPIAETYPELAELLVGSDPSMIFADSRDAVEWRCENGHVESWPPRTYVNKRCSACRGGTHSHSPVLSTLPVAALLDPEQDGIERILAERSHSKAPAMWLCDRGHSFSRRIARYVDGERNCSRCKRPHATLAEARPDLALEWSPKNELPASQVASRINLPAWWTCTDCGHEWETLVANRVHKGSGCPSCWKRRGATSLVEKELSGLIAATLGEEVAKQQYVSLEGRRHFIDISTADGILIEYDSRYWHGERETDDAERTERLERGGHQLIRVREEGLSHDRALDIVYAPRRESLAEVASAVAALVLELREKRRPG